jgi:hypothetical protein
MSTNMKFRVSTVEIEDNDEDIPTVRQTVEALAPNGDVITTFAIACTLDEAGSLSRLQTQCRKKFSDYQDALRSAKAVEKLKAEALALQGKVVE